MTRKGTAPHPLGKVPRDFRLLPVGQHPGHGRVRDELGALGLPVLLFSSESHSGEIWPPKVGPTDLPFWGLMTLVRGAKSVLYHVGGQ